MNSIMSNYYPIFGMYQGLRNDIMAILSDDDLRYQPTANNPTLGALCREIGEVEHAYIESFKTWKQDFGYRNTEPGLETSVERLNAWFDELDRELKRTIEGLSETDLQERLVERGPDFKLPPQIQLEVYKEALLIFYGKVSVYLKSLGKPLPERFAEWIG